MIPKLEEWLKDQDFEEILEENDLEPVDVLECLFQHGLVKIPLWMEDEFQETEDE